MTARPEAFFVSVGHGPLGQRFCLYHVPAQSPPVGVVVYVHPFAEAMEQVPPDGRIAVPSIGRGGVAVLQIDLLGCGDSAGDFADASWAEWRSDVDHAAVRLRERHPVVPVWLVGPRVGALLAVEAAAEMELACNFLLWQPVSSGASALQQFLRLSTAGEMLTGEVRGYELTSFDGNSIRAKASSAGHRISPALALALEAATLNAPRAPRRVDWFEVSSERPARTFAQPPFGSPSIARGRPRRPYACGGRSAVLANDRD